MDTEINGYKLEHLDKFREWFESEYELLGNFSISFPPTKSVF